MYPNIAFTLNNWLFTSVRMLVLLYKYRFILALYIVFGTLYSFSTLYSFQHFIQFYIVFALVTLIPLYIYCLLLFSPICSYSLQSLWLFYSYEYRSILALYMVFIFFVSLVTLISLYRYCLFVGFTGFPVPTSRAPYSLFVLINYGVYPHEQFKKSTLHCITFISLNVHSIGLLPPSPLHRTLRITDNIKISL